jgi:hypothetical protein
MTPAEKVSILVRATELLEIVDCLVQSTVPESCYDIHNDIENVKDSIQELTDTFIQGDTV